MKKIFMLATAAFLFTGAFANTTDCCKGKGKGKKSCCKKSGSCCKDEDKTAKM